MIEFKRKKLELVSDAKIVALYKDYLETPDGTTVCYDYIKHKTKGGAGILLVDGDENTYLVKQYRNSIDAVDMEIPAGGYAYRGEAGDECAKREAEEETGFIPTEIFHVANAVSAIGTFDEKTDIYIGTGLRRGNVKLDADEFIDVVKLSVDDALGLVFDGTIVDSKTILALFAYKHMRNSGIIRSL